jgi:hypothetical protein
MITTTERTSPVVASPNHSLLIVLFITIMNALYVPDIKMAPKGQLLIPATTSSMSNVKAWVKQHKKLINSLFITAFCCVVGIRGYEDLIEDQRLMKEFKRWKPNIDSMAARPSATDSSYSGATYVQEKHFKNKYIEHYIIANHLVLASSLTAQDSQWIREHHNDTWFKLHKKEVIATVCLVVAFCTFNYWTWDREKADKDEKINRNEQNYPPFYTKSL